MIKANFNAYANYVTDSLYQWDRNQILSVSGFNISTAPEVHFYNSAMDKAIVKQSTFIDRVVTVQIPNSLLQNALTIYANIGVYEDNTFKTVETITIPVIAKARPADYQLENNDGEVYSFEELKNHIANMVKLKDFNANNTVINARINNIITHNNDTNGNTELIDIRTGADGEIYSSAGEAVRQQFKIVEDRLIETTIDYPLQLTPFFENSYINNEGVISQFGANNYVKCCTIPVQKGDIISLKTNFGTMAYLFDNNNTPIKHYAKVLYGISEDDTVYGEISDTIMIDNGYIVFNQGMTNLENYYFKITRYVDKTLNIESLKINDLIAKITTLNDKVVELSTDELSGKNISCMGDSITAGVFLNDVENECYTNIIANLTGANVENLGVSGSKISNIDTDEVESFVDRVVNITNSDYIVIFGGTNDYWHGVTNIGAVDSENIEEFTGALNYLFDYIYTNFPNAKILYVFPFRQYNGAVDTTNNGHGSFNDFRLGAKSVCDNKSVVMLDLYSQGGINPATNETHRELYTIDGYHLNANGHKLLADKIIKMLKQL